jgi:outer membrane receptor protein involved in Fe transport
MLSRWILIVPFVSLAPAWAGAQSTDAKIVGRVSDRKSGAPLAGVAVEVRNDGSLLAQGVSAEDGSFALPAVPPGACEMLAILDGYYSLVHPLELKPRDALRLRLELVPVSGVEERVEVTAAAPFIDPQRTGSSTYLTRTTLESMPAHVVADVTTLAEYTMPGAIGGHDNFVHVRGNELSLHQFINGVSFLDNPHQHFFPGLSPEIFESVNMVTGGFPAEFGNRFGGVLDITTRSGASMNGSGSASFRAGGIDQRSVAADYGGSKGRLGYFVYGGAFQTDRYLNPPQPDELHDHGEGARGDVQLDYRGDKDFFRLLVTGGGTNFDLPNTADEQEVGRDARRELSSVTTILSWQRAVSEETLVSTALYQRHVSDRLLPTSDPVTSFADGSRSTSSLGAKVDWYHASGIHQWKAGLDFSHLGFAESLFLDAREQGSGGELDQIAFDGNDHGSVVGLYLQDRMTPLANLTLDLGLRFDDFDILRTEHQLSPRVGAAYHFDDSGTVLRASYSRLFTPPPIEYILLASYLGDQPEGDQEPVGAVRAYRQHLFEGGLSQHIHGRLFMDVGAYHHTGDDSFENTEIANTRLFVPTNFSHARASGLEIAIEARAPGATGLSGRLEYSLAKVEFLGPVSGGLPEEQLEPGEIVAPAFDQRHTVVASGTYRSPWRGLEANAFFRYGSGTPVEEEGAFRYLPQHGSLDLMARVDLWSSGPQALQLRVDATNVTNNIYSIAKESELTPIQYAPRRSVAAEIVFRF